MPFLAVAAVVAGGAVAAGAIAASTVAMIGLGASIVGMVTKSKELSQIGAGMSLGAGVAGIADSVFGGASTAAGTAEAGTSALTSGESAVGSAEGINAAAGSAGAAGTTDATLASTAAGSTEGLSSTGAASPVSGSTGGLLNASPVTEAPLSATPQSSLMPGTSNIIGQSAANGAVGASVLTPPVATDSGSIFSWFAKQPESVKNKILQVGGQAAGGLFEGWSAEQKLAVERERLNLEKQKFDTQQSNASAQPRVAFQNYTPPTGGLLNPMKRG